MGTYDIHKGIDKPVEFKGLTGQYLFIFAGGLLLIFVVLVILVVAGADQFFCVGLGASLAVGLIIVTFRLNKKYGRFGLMKRTAIRRHPRRIISRKSVQRLFNDSNKCKIH